VSSWATRTHASLRPLIAADAPARSRAWILAQRKGCGRVPIAIKKIICVHAIRAAAMSAQSPDPSIDRGIPRLGLGCHVQRPALAFGNGGRTCKPCWHRGTDRGRWRSGTGQSARRRSNGCGKSFNRARASQAPLRIGNILANIPWRSVRTDKKISFDRTGPSWQSVPSLALATICPYCSEGVRPRSRLGTALGRSLWLSPRSFAQPRVRPPLCPALQPGLPRRFSRRI
jgi:hypothetical protein